MKKILILTLLLLGLASVYGQDSTYTITYQTRFMSSTLTATLDTFVVKVPTFDYITIGAWASSGADTIVVDTKKYDSSEWVAISLWDLSSSGMGSPTENIITSTTKKQWLIKDPDIKEIRLRTTDVTVATTFEVQCKGRRRE